MINVTFASSREDVSDREIDGLIEAVEELKCSKIRVITWDYFEEGKISFTPLWYWLLTDGYFQARNS